MATDPRDAVLAQLELAYERHCVDEQTLRTTDPEKAEIHHEMAVRILRARLIEEENPKPAPPAAMHCFSCAWAYATHGR